MRLSDNHPIFIGFKLDGSLKRELQAITGPDKRYVSTDESTFLRLCTLNDKLYVGKVIEEPLTTDRIEDIRRNVLSILRRLCPDTRLPTIFGIWPCLNDAGVEDPGARSSEEALGELSGN